MHFTNGLAAPGPWNNLCVKMAKRRSVRLTWLRPRGSLTFSFSLMSRMSARDALAVAGFYLVRHQRVVERPIVVTLDDVNHQKRLTARRKVIGSVASKVQADDHLLEAGGLCRAERSGVSPRSVHTLVISCCMTECCSPFVPRARRLQTGAISSTVAT